MHIQFAAIPLKDPKKSGFTLGGNEVRTTSKILFRPQIHAPAKFREKHSQRAAIKTYRQNLANYGSLLRERLLQLSVMT